MINSRIQEFSSGRGGGGGDSGPSGIKKALTMLFLIFFLVLNLFYRSPVVTFKENYQFPRFQWGWTILGGGGGGATFPGGPIAFSL